MDITPFLNRTLDIPLYQQLYRYFKENMHRGRIQKGMKLAFFISQDLPHNSPHDFPAILT